MQPLHPRLYRTLTLNSHPARPCAYICPAWRRTHLPLCLSAWREESSLLPHPDQPLLDFNIGRADDKGKESSRLFFCPSEESDFVPAGCCRDYAQSPTAREARTLCSLGHSITPPGQLPICEGLWTGVSGSPPCLIPTESRCKAGESTVKLPKAGCL